MTISLARRYRPKRFADLLVQDHVAAVLRGAVARGRVGHGYLLTGPRGVGKTTAARILAMALNCPNRREDGDPCGECQSCERIWGGSASLDVIEIDAASNRGVDDARDLRERAMYAASEESHYKVYIVDEAHMLTREAWNALLKILEEPPPRVVFVFATTEPQKIANTAAPVMSRLQRFDFRRIGPGAIRERLEVVLAAEGIEAEADALILIARHADGGMRDALSVLDQCLSFGDGIVTAARVRETLGLTDEEHQATLLRAVAERDGAAVFALVDELMRSGADLGEFLIAAGEMLRAMLMLQVGSEPEGLTVAARAVIDEHREALAPGDLLRMLKLLAEHETAVRRSGQPRLVVETLLLRWVMLDRTVDLESLLAGGGRRPAEPSSASSSGGGDPVPRQGRSSPARAAPTSQRGDPAARRSTSPAAALAPDAGSASVAAASGVPETSAAPGPTSEFTLEGLSAVWPALVDAVRAESRFLGEALAATTLAAVAPPQITVQFADVNPLLHERLERQARVVEGVLTAAVGAPARLAVAGPAGGGAHQPEQLTEAGLRQERLKGLRRRDPALDAAADELDLEIVDQ